MAEREATLAAAWLDLRRNEAAHARELEQAEDMGYGPIAELPGPPSWTLPEVRAHHVPPACTGMGPACPFATRSDLVYETVESPLLSDEECGSIIDETSAHIAAGKSGSGFTLATTNRNIEVASLPRTLDWLISTGLPRVAAVAGHCYGEGALGDPARLRIYRALVVQYDADAGLTHQEVHRDGSLVTCVVTLNARDQYTGGGTYLEPLGTALAPPKGHAVLQASAIRHAGHMIESGERWVLVLFMIAEEMKYGEHVRHLKSRAQRAAEDGDEATETHCLELARTVCADEDHELLYDQAVGLHERGEVAAALALYEKAAALNSHDAKLQNNLAAARRELGIGG